MITTRRLTTAGPARTSRPHGRRAATIAMATTGAFVVWAIADPLAGPSGGTTLATVVALAAMHVVVGATLILGIGSTLYPSSNETGARPESGEER